MNLELGQLTGKNFQSFKELDLDFSAIKSTSTLVLGENRDDELASSNGSGKSAILEAISWVLFGTTFRPLRYTDEVINIQENECYIKLVLFLNEKEYTIARTKTKNKPAVLRILEGTTELLKDSDTKSKQAQLESIIGFNFLTFTNSIMFHLDYIAFPELKPAERAEILTDIGNLEIYVKAATQAKFESAQINSEIYTTNVQISAIDKIISQLRQEDYEPKIQNWEEEKIRQIRELRRFLIELKNEDKNEKERLSNNIILTREIIGKLNEDIDIKQEHYDTLTENLEEEIEKNENREKQLLQSSATMASEINALKNEITKYNKDIINIQTLKDGRCPTCQQNVTAEHTDACTSVILKNITDAQSQIDEKKALYDRLKASLTELNSELIKYKQRKTKANAVKEGISILNRDLVKEQGNLKTFTNQLENFEITQTRIIQDKEIQLDKKQNEINPYIEVKATQERQISEKEKEISTLKDEIAKLTDEQQYVNFFIDGFKKIKLMLFDDLVNRLNELSQEYLSRYTSELAVKISCERQTKTGTKDELHIEVDRPEGTISYAAYSGGERQKIKLSISLALAQLIEEMCDRNCNVVFFDEPNNGLDNIGKRSNFDVFSDLATQGKTVVVIDHDAYFQDEFNNIITVIKEKGYSRIENGI